jgi:hypothetical protein
MYAYLFFSEDSVFMYLLERLKPKDIFPLMGKSHKIFFNRFKISKPFLIVFQIFLVLGPTRTFHNFEAYAARIALKI